MDDTPDHLDVQLPTHRLSALTWGPPDGPLALLLHGYPDTAWTWRHLGPALGADGYRVVAPFTRGYAPSDLAPDGRYGVGALVHDALAVHRALAADDRAVLVGHDWGAITAHGVGVHDPGAFRRMVTIAVPPLAAMQQRSLRALARQLVRSRYIGVALLPLAGERLHARGVADLWARWSPGYDATEDLAHLAVSLPDRAHWRAALGYYRGTANPWATVRGPYAKEQRAALGGAGVPTLVLHGDQDGAVGPDLLAAAAARVPHSALVAGTGHFLPLEDPATTERLVREFLGAP